MRVHQECSHEQHTHNKKGKPSELQSEGNSRVFRISQFEPRSPRPRLAGPNRLSEVFGEEIGDENQEADASTDSPGVSTSEHADKIAGKVNGIQGVDKMEYTCKIMVHFNKILFLKASCLLTSAFSLFPARRVFFRKKVDEVVQTLLEDDYPDAVKLIADTPIELADEALIQPAKEIAQAVEYALQGVGGAVSEVSKVGTTAIESVVVTAATPFYVVGTGLKKAFYDAPVQVYNKEFKEAAKSFFSGTIWHTLRAVGRTLENGIKGVVNTGMSAVQGAIKAPAKLLFGMDISNGDVKTGAGLAGAVKSLWGGAMGFLSAPLRTKMAQSLIRESTGDWRLPMSIRPQAAAEAVEDVIEDAQQLVEDVEELKKAA